MLKLNGNTAASGRSYAFLTERPLHVFLLNKSYPESSSGLISTLKQVQG